MKPFFPLSILALLMACTGSPNKELIENAPSISLTLKRTDGTQLVLKEAPKKLISIAPNITEIIYALGAEAKLVACSEACDYPDETAMLEQVSLRPSLDIQQLAEIEADLILGTHEVFGGAAATVVEQLATPLWNQAYDSLGAIYEGIREIGKVTELTQQAEALADSLEAVENRITEAAEPEINYNTAIVVSIDPLQVAGGTGILQEMIDKAGGKNAFANQSTPFLNVSPSQLLQAQPEYLILPFGSDQAYADLIALYPILTNTPADLHKQVFIVDPDLFFRPGPRMLEGLAELAHILHSNLQKDQFFKPNKEE